MEGKTRNILEKSKEVIRACTLSNGAIVAANSCVDTYSKEAKNYLYVWPRDASFTCIAADDVGIDDIQEPFFDWVINRAEGFQEKNLLYEKYYPNGLQALNRFQPDQGAALIYAIWYHFKDKLQDADKYRDLITRLADGICENWLVDHFNLITNDLWEERLTFPDLKDNFSYSLAACIKALRTANSMYPDGKYGWVANEMENAVITKAKENVRFIRAFGLLNDDRTDASLMGLIWPFEIVPANDLIAENTINEIIGKLDYDGGIHRYEHDEYDGWMFQTFHRKKRAGYWPLLNFWLAIILEKMNRHEDAMRYYNQTVDKISEETCLIPEQVFTNDLQKSICPLCWSHAMFIEASKELGLLE